MRDIEIVSYRWLDMQKLRAITKEVYGKEYDVQMGEYANGSYHVASTNRDDVMADPDGYMATPGDYNSWVDLTPEESVQRWLDTPPPANRYERDLENQPSLWVILSDLAFRDEIPEGEYFVDISW